MPSPPPECTFRGTAAEVHIRGEGAAKLTRREAFSAPHATRVELRDAQVGSAKGQAIEQPKDLTPVNDNPDGVAYGVTYTAGPPLVVTIDVGGKPGSVYGPRCEAGCDVVWGHGPKAITAYSTWSKPIAITGTFPHGQIDPDLPKPPRVAEVVLRGASGTIVCGKESTSFDGREIAWKSGVRSAGPVVLEREGLGVTVVSDGKPEGLPISVPLAARVGVGVGLAALLLVGAAKLRRKLTPRPPATPHPQVEVLLLHAPVDAALREKLHKHLRVFERRGEMACCGEWTVRPGEDRREAIAAMTERAQVILLLVSVDFMAGDALWDAVVQRALDRHDAKEAKVIPVILRACDWQSSRLGTLGPLPEGGKPVTLWASEDEAFQSVARGVKEAIRVHRGGREKP